MISVIFIIIGAGLLLKGADLLVDGGTGLALKSGISPLVVGLTIVAFGTSAPELTASLVAALKGSGDISFGNVVGSNCTNIALILGVTALIRPLAINISLVKWELPFLIGISVLTCGVGLIQYTNRLIGIGFLVLFFIYIMHCKKSPPVKIDVDDKKVVKTFPVLIFMVLLGIAGLSFGGMLFVKGARNIAVTLGVSEAIIGLTVVAIGTSLPELITSVIASLKGHADISLGNIVGSNIFNILLVLGATSVIQPFIINDDNFLKMVGMPAMMGLTVVLLLFSVSGTRISRIEGILFFIVYLLYCVLAVVMA